MSNSTMSSVSFFAFLSSFSWMILARWAVNWSFFSLLENKPSFAEIYSFSALSYRFLKQRINSVISKINRPLIISYSFNVFIYQDLKADENWWCWLTMWKMTMMLMIMMMVMMLEILIDEGTLSLVAASSASKLLISSEYS